MQFVEKELLYICGRQLFHVTMAAVTKAYYSIINNKVAVFYSAFSRPGRTLSPIAYS